MKNLRAGLSDLKLRRTMISQIWQGHVMSGKAVPLGGVWVWACGLAGQVLGLLGY